MASNSAEKPVNTLLSGIDALSAPVAENPAERRKLLRRERIAAREALDATQHRQLSAALEQHLAALLQRCKPRVLGFCWPFRAEYDARPLIMRVLATGGQVCLPVVIRADAPLQFRCWQPDAAMETDRYGIHYPAQGELLHPDVLLMPVNAFDAAGYRLGYGAGYFDRTLAAMQPPPLTIGTGFELARVASIHPEAHDIPLDAVVTEAGVNIFSARLRVLLQSSDIPLHRAGE